MAEETIQDDEPTQTDLTVDSAPDSMADTAVDNTVDEDEFDRLRRKSTLASSVYDDMEIQEEDGSTNPLSRLSATQTIILLILLVIDILAIGFLVYWIMTG